MYGSEDQLGSYGEPEDWAELTSQEEPSAGSAVKVDNAGNAHLDMSHLGQDPKVVTAINFSACVVFLLRAIFMENPFFDR